VGDRCAQRAAYLEELDRVLDLMSGFNLTDLFPTSRLAKALGGRALKATWEVHHRIHAIMEAMISDHKVAMESEGDNADAGGDQRGDILTILLRFQRNGGMGGGVTLTNANISGVLFVSQPPLVPLLPTWIYTPQKYFDLKTFCHMTRIFLLRARRRRRPRRPGPCRS
jgi:hypothetical protein